jgi:hypothetical protein
VVAESRAHASSMGDARRAMELSRERMYAERSKRNRTIMLYTTGSVSLLSLGRCSWYRALDQCSLYDAGLEMSIQGGEDNPSKNTFIRIRQDR